MNTHIIVKRNLCIQGGIHTSGENHLHGLIQGIHTGNGCAVLLCKEHVGAVDAVCSGASVQILKGFDVFVVLAHDQCGANEAVRIAEVVFFLSLVGHVHAVYHEVIAIVVKSCKKTVPFALYKGCLHA